MAMKYFKPDKDWQYNSRILKDDNKWLFYGEGYRIACELLEKQILEIDRSKQDFLIYPYCYLMRQYIEIRLKEIIDEGGNLKFVRINPAEHQHNLLELWKTSQSVIADVWKDHFQVAPKDVSDFIKEFHNIDIKSDNFRYPIDKKGNENLRNINEINFKKLSEIFQMVKYYLDGATDGLAIAKENSYEK